MTILHYLIIISIVISYPISHVFLKKAMLLDNNPSETKIKNICKLFYIPLINLVSSFLYLVWVVILFKKV